MLLYLHGFASSPGSTKAQAFRHRFAQAGLDLVVPALDDGDFEHLTVSSQLAVVERALAGAPGPHVLIGSSMGGYVAALHASRHAVDALVLMAPGFDFARRLVERHGASAMNRWRDSGWTEVEHYGLGRRARLSYALVDDAAEHEPYPRAAAPALVLHGLRDDVVPAAAAERWVSIHPDARLVTYDTGHELTDVFDAIFAESCRFLAGIPAVARAHPGLATLAGSAPPSR